jgi:hypothetical protein
MGEGHRHYGLGGPARALVAGNMEDLALSPPSLSPQVSATLQALAPPAGNFHFFR